MSMKSSDFGPRKYKDGRTKQAFKDSTDINKILKKAQKTGSLSHALKYTESSYGEFTGVDLLGAFEQINRAQAIFDDLPSEVRTEFGNDALKFAGYASDPANIGRLPELLPAIAAPGIQLPNPISRSVSAPEPIVDPVPVVPVVAGSPPGAPAVPAEPVIPSSST